jgi:L-threonine kinase
MGIGLVSFPVDRYAWAHFTEGAGDAEPLPALPKAAQSVRLFLHRYGLRLPPGAWSSHTELDIGVGMASSTADIVATLRCLFQVFGLPVDMAAVTGVLARIERADSVFLDEFSLYLSDRHEIVHNLGTAVGFHTCFVVEPGAVDTAAVTPRLLEHYRRRRAAYQECLDDLLDAFRMGDTAAVARAATTSATLSQDVLPKASYDAVVANRRYFGADGIFVAHTGRVIGYLFAARLARARMDELSAFFRDLGFQCSFAWGGHGSA